MTTQSEPIDEILDELQAQVIDGYTQPVNGWTTVKQLAKAEINAHIERVVREAEQKPVGDAIEIDVPNETMQAVFSRIKLLDKTVAKRTLEPEWLVKKWRTGEADEYDLSVEIWKLRILASLAGFNWSVFLLKPKNLKGVWRKKSLKQTNTPNTTEGDSDEYDL